jgi:biotin carboxyl carrier protein
MPATPPDIVEVEPGVYSVILNGASYEVRVEAAQISIAGHRYPIELDDPRQWKRPGSGAGVQGLAAIVAPMPGKIVRILVAEGDLVEAGQGILVVEAMKMQNELKAPRAGTVTSIAVKAGDGVNAGAVLATVV